jgi:ABC-type sugar transport system substrate-binding protein
MKLREFISLFGGAAAAWPIAARAQQGDRIRRIGVLMGIESGPDARTRIAAFRQALRESGWTDDRNREPNGGLVVLPSPIASEPDHWACRASPHPSSLSLPLLRD